MPYDARVLRKPSVLISLTYSNIYHIFSNKTAIYNVYIGYLNMMWNIMTYFFDKYVPVGFWPHLKIHQSRCIV